MSLIDKSLPEFDDVPTTLEWEVLLERTVDDKGNPSGFLTATPEVVKYVQSLTPPERAANGWDVHQVVLTAMIPILVLLPTPANAMEALAQAATRGKNPPPRP